VVRSWQRSVGTPIWLVALWLTTVRPDVPLYAQTQNALADADEAERQKKEAKERKDRYEKWMLEFAEGTTIRLRRPDNGEHLAKLVATPVFRYSGDNIHADDATLWVWTYEGRPVAFEKLEVNNIPHILDGRNWTVCFGSVCENLFDVQWPGGRRYSSAAPGVEFRPIPDAPSPAVKAKQRTRQLRNLKDRFTGATFGPTPQGTADYDLKPLPTPVFEYADPESKLPRGAVFNLVNHERGELNPVLLLLLEARPDEAGNLRWKYASRRLGIWSTSLRLDGQEASYSPIVRMSDEVQKDWTFYFLPRDFD
jgi:hypothetical protein